MMVSVKTGSYVDVFTHLQERVIQSGFCTHCGTCAGLSHNQIYMQETEEGPLPRLVGLEKIDLLQEIEQVCPGKGLDYPVLNEYIFSQQPDNWLVGCVRKAYIGYSGMPNIRSNGASGGVITQILVDLLRNKQIEGAVVLRHGHPEPWLSEPIIASTEEEIKNSSQSVYVPIAVNCILNRVEDFDGRLAYVGLPDQVAAMRALQRIGHPAAKKVEYVIGPYVGTAFYLKAIASYLASNHVPNIDEIEELRYREGEWPGFLQIRIRSGRVLRERKFYYNYLIPFYITRSSLLSVDFTNELTDISVGDAWHPRLESQGKGYSVVLARSEKGESLLKNLQDCGHLVLEETTLEEVISMHGHMLDFKKRGSFIRISWLRFLGKQAPQYGYFPQSMPISRWFVEAIISGIFGICRTPIARRLVEIVPVSFTGNLFEMARRLWKRISKPVKRRGLLETKFCITRNRGLNDGG